MLWLIQFTLALCALSDFYVSHIPDADSIDLPQMYSGSLEVPIESHTEPMFFWFYESKFRTTKPKTLIWLNGGPGCSSLDGALLELGPLRFLGNNKFEYNQGNWGEYLNILYLDQPLGTGYSFLNDPSDAVTDVEAAASLVDKFLEMWLSEFPHHAHDDFYLGGESYAGQYIPYIQKQITAIDTKGLILVNPWIDPAHQYLSYMPFVKEIGIISETQYPRLEHLHNDCAKSLSSKSMVGSDDGVCNKITSFVLEQSGKEDRCINVYNYKLDDSFPSCGLNWPPGVNDMPLYLNRPEVLEALHVNRSSTTASRWTECSNVVQKTFRNYGKASASSFLPQLLDEVPIMILVGDLDFVCNYRGLDDMVDNMSWGGQEPTSRGWLLEEKQQQQNITVNGTTVGTFINGRNLTMARIHNGSHMIPVDKQFETRAMVHWFTGVTREVGDKAPLDQQSEQEPEQPPSENDNKESEEATRARKNAYKRAGVTALIVIILIILALGLWLVLKGDVHLSWSHITSGFSRALLHSGTPGLRKPFEYVNLSTFTPTGRPSPILEEDEEDFTV